MAEKSLPDQSRLSKLPPQNVEAEAAVLGAALVNQEAIDKVADILVDHDFYRENHQAIYRAVLRLFERRSPIDLVTLTNELEALKELDAVGGAAYLAQLVNSVPTAIHVEHYANIVRHKAILRRILQAGQRITALGYDEEKEVQEILDDAESALFGVSRQLLKDNFQPISDILAESFDRIDKLHREKGMLRGVPTGFKDLDNKLSGLQSSDLVILAARPSMGKTTFALNIALNAAVKAKVPVGFFSLEQSKEQIVDRLICAQAMVDGWKLRTGNLSEDDFPAIGMAMGSLSEAPIYIDDSPMMTPIEIRTKARRLRAEKQLGLIVIDYLQLLESHRRGGNDGNRVQEVSEISRSLKALARELNVPVLALSQLSRAVESRDRKIPQLSDLRESGCLAADTKIVRADTGQAVTLKELADRPEQTPVPVFSLDENYKLVIKPMVKAFSSGYKRLYQLTTKSGRLIKASANHPFRRLDGWQRLDKLRSGDRVALPRELKVAKPNSAITNDELILLAHLIGDGCLLPRQPFHYTSADVDNLKIVSETAARLFSIDSRPVKQKNWWHLYLPSPYRLARGSRHPITKWYQGLALDLCRSWQKRLPEAVLTANSNQIRLFLHHLWATDGNISWKNLPGREQSGAIYYSSTSLVLAHQVQHLLLRLGIISTLRQVAQGQHRPSYQAHIQGKTDQLKFLNLVGCFGARGKIIPELRQALERIQANPNTDVLPRDVWGQAIAPAKVRAGLSWRQVSAGLEMSYCGSSLFKSGVSRTRMTRLAQVLNDTQLAQLSASDVYWDEITSIESLGVEEVYDATVPGTHNFVANDIIVHNSIEQDADLVMFLYREEYYDKDTEKKGITDILIRKHRNGPIGEVELHFKIEQARFYDIERRVKASA